jgi:integrase
MKPCPRTDGRHEVYPSTQYPSKVELDDLINQSIDRHRRELQDEYKNLPNSKVTLKEVHKKYIEWFNKRIGTKNFTKRTRNIYERCGRNYVYPTSIADKPIGDIDEIDLLNYYDDLHELFLMDGLGADLYLNISVVLNHIFNHAIQNRFITDNPYTQLVRNKANNLRHHIKEEYVAEAKNIDVDLVIKFVDFVQEISRFENRFSDLAQYLLVTLHLATRSAETCGIYLDDIDFNKRTIHIKRQTFKLFGSTYTGSETEIVTKSLKTKAGNRIIPLSDDLINLFKRIDIDYREGVLVPDTTGNKPLWQYPNGLPNIFRNQLKKFLRKHGADFGKRTGKEYNYVFHALRHAGISIWIRHGIDSHRVMTMAGHSSIQTTFNIYGNPVNQNEYFNMSDLIKEVREMQ